MRLIDADALYDEIEYDALFSVQTAKDIVELIFSAPTVDAVEVVRCKDCVCSRGLHEKEKWLYVEDTLMCGFFDRAVPNDGFCDNAERRG